MSPHLPSFVYFVDAYNLKAKDCKIGFSTQFEFPLVTTKCALGV